MKRNLIFVAVFLAVLLLLSAVLFLGSDQAILDPEPAGLVVQVPVSGQVVTSPLHIRGLVNGGGWTGFEGQVGTVHLFDEHGGELAVTFLPATTEWTKLPTHFETTLDFISPGQGSGQLVFRNENASGDPARDKIFIVPIKFSK